MNKGHRTAVGFHAPFPPAFSSMALVASATEVDTVAATVADAAEAWIDAAITATCASTQRHGDADGDAAATPLLSPPHVHVNTHAACHAHSDGGGRADAAENRPGICIASNKCATKEGQSCTFGGRRGKGKGRVGEVCGSILGANERGPKLHLRGSEAVITHEHVITREHAWLRI